MQTQPQAQPMQPMMYPQPMMNPVAGIPGAGAASFLQSQYNQMGAQPTMGGMAPQQTQALLAQLQQLLGGGVRY